MIPQKFTNIQLGSILKWKMELWEENSKISLNQADATPALKTGTASLSLEVQDFYPGSPRGKAQRKR
jgi:hypothetical protein